MFEKIWERLKKLLAKQIKKDIEEVSFVKVEEPESQQNSKDKAASSIDKTAKHLSTGSERLKNTIEFNSNQQELFDRLKSLRTKLASKNNQPAYVVFSDNTLRSMVFKKPKNKSELLQIKGVGEVKFGLYGKEFLELLANSAVLLNPSDQVLFERLKFLRLGFARKIGKPAFTVFHDKTLLDMIAKMPKNEADMLEVGGVGPIKFSKYGEDFLELIADRANNSKIEFKPPSVIEDNDHHDYLIRKIDSSKTRLIVISGWITQHVIDNAFLRLMVKKLDQGVKIYLGYGFQDYDGNHNEFGGSKAALRSLQKLARQYPNQLFVACFATHEKLLLVDSKSVAIGSANWLANRKYENNSERSIVIANNNTFVEQEAVRAIKLIEQNLVE